MTLVINGIVFPSDVHDVVSLSGWIESIDRPRATSNSRTFGPVLFKSNGQTEHREVYRAAPFFADDPASEAAAIAHCCQYTAMEMYHDLIMVPGGALIMRVPFEHGIYDHMIVPKSYSEIKTRQVLEREGKLAGTAPISLESILPDPLWAVDFLTDTLIKRADGSERLRYFKTYIRYSCAVVANKEEAA